jgi:putative transcriptional regulator
MPQKISPTRDSQGSQRADTHGLCTPLRRIRLSTGRSIHDVAGAVHTTAGNLSRIENGKQRPSAALAARLAKEFASQITEMQILYPERFGAV